MRLRRWYNVTLVEAQSRKPGMSFAAAQNARILVLANLASLFTIARPASFLVGVQHVIVVKETDGSNALGDVVIELGLKDRG